MQVRMIGILSALQGCLKAQRCGSCWVTMGICLKFDLFWPCTTPGTALFLLILPLFTCFGSVSSYGLYVTTRDCFADMLWWTSFYGLHISRYSTVYFDSLLSCHRSLLASLGEHHHYYWSIAPQLVHFFLYTTSTSTLHKLLMVI